MEARHVASGGSVLNRRYGVKSQPALTRTCRVEKRLTSARGGTAAVGERARQRAAASHMSASTQSTIDVVRSGCAIAPSVCSCWAEALVRAAGVA